MSLSKDRLSATSPFLTYSAIVIFISVVVAVLFYINGNCMIGIDDANIYFIYMKNFANGYGFEYNRGGEHVEGFTSLLWTLTGAVFFRFTSQPEIILLIINILIVSYSV